ncbi:MAG TPA: condensation domain-containing protein, partial [Thermoanaerobaculia bacterium]|nr:condensation domain-containing protein [Thermoanaerobaculia bacterium]
MDSTVRIENVYVLSPLQQGLLFHDLLAPESGLYIDQLVFELRGGLDVPALESAWQEVAGRHPAVRTSFHWEEIERPVQIVHAGMELPLERHDWSGETPAAREERL